MKSGINKEQTFQLSKTVYGPVKSWRFGQSLGIDPLFHTSTCSFNCIYCQLGRIQNITTQIKEYVSTQKVLADFREVSTQGKQIDIIMYSGSGEPTLAKNLGEISHGIRNLSPEIPQAILTNAVHLDHPLVQESLQKMDKVILKLDAANEKGLQTINRPAPGITLKSILKGIQSFKQNYHGTIELQLMLLPGSKMDWSTWCTYLKEIHPHSIQLNTPKRAYPLKWHRENRGNHKGVHDHITRPLKTLKPEDMTSLANTLHQKTGIDIVYRP